MRTLFVAQGPLEWASSRYRAWWVAEFADWADCVQMADLKGLDWSEYGAVVWPKPCGLAERQILANLKASDITIAWDVCDPMWWLRPDDAGEMLNLVDMVVCSNDGLRENLTLEYKYDRAHTITDRMNPAFHPDAKEHRAATSPVLLWYGQHWNRLPCFASAALGLQRLVSGGARFRVRILDDGPPGGVEVGGVDVEYHRWRLDTFHEELLAADVVLNAPYPGPWGAMKSTNKRDTAWWAGVPTINLQSVADVERARELFADPVKRQVEGAAARAEVERTCDVRQSVEEWRELLYG